MMYTYKPLGKTTGLDYRSTFTFTSGGKAPSSETKYSAVTLDVMPETQYISPSQAWLDFFCTGSVKLLSYFLFIITFPLSAIVCFKMAHQYERIVVYRIGRLLPLKGPGLVLVLPCIDRWSKVDLRTKAFNVPPTRICSSDGGLVLIGGIIHYRVQSPLLVKNSLQDMNHSVRVMSQAAMSKVLSKKRFSEIMSTLSRYNYDIQIDINDVAHDWGLEIGKVELSQPIVEVAPPAPQSGFLSGFGGGGGSGDAISQVMGMMAGSVNATKGPTQKKAQKSEFAIIDVERAAENLLHVVRTLLNEELVSKVSAGYEIKLTDNGNFYYIDLKSGAGGCGKGHLPNGDPDTTLILKFNTLQDLLSGEAGAFSAYTSGELEVQGDVKTAMRLEELAKCLKR